MINKKYALLISIIIVLALLLFLILTFHEQISRISFTYFHILTKEQAEKLRSEISEYEEKLATVEEKIHLYKTEIKNLSDSEFKNTAKEKRKLKTAEFKERNKQTVLDFMKKYYLSSKNVAAILTYEDEIILELNPEEKMVAASTIKVPYCMAIMDKIDQKTLNFNSVTVITANDYEDSTGIVASSLITSLRQASYFDETDNNSKEESFEPSEQINNADENSLTALNKNLGDDKNIDHEIEQAPLWANIAQTWDVKNLLDSCIRYSDNIAFHGLNHFVNTSEAYAQFTPALPIDYYVGNYVKADAWLSLLDKLQKEKRYEYLRKLMSEVEFSYGLKESPAGQYSNFIAKYGNYGSNLGLVASFDKAKFILYTNGLNFDSMSILTKKLFMMYEEYKNFVVNEEQLNEASDKQKLQDLNKKVISLEENKVEIEKILNEKKSLLE